MKRIVFTHALIALFGCAALASIAGAQTPPPAKEAPSNPGVALALSSPGPTASPAGPDLGTARWSDIEGYSYDQRAQFFVGLQRLEARVDDQIGRFNAKRAAMAGATDTQDWDTAMRAMESARTYLMAMGEESKHANDENWSQEKDKVGQAWTRTQEANDQVKTSTTR